MSKTLFLVFLFALSPNLISQEISVQEIKLWGEGPVPFNKAYISLEEVVDSTGRRISQISVPRLYIYQRTGHREAGPAMMFIPGGGYARIALKDQGRSQAERFLQYGFDVVAVLVYRLPDPRIVDEAYKVPLCDAQKALSLLHQHAGDWHIDSDQIAVMGSSAGGHLTACLANLSEHPVAPGVQAEMLKQAFNILLYPVISFQPPYVHQGSRKRLLGEASGDPELLETYSMEKQVSEQTPPTLLIHAKDDASVPYQNSLIYLEQLKNRGVSCDYIELIQGGHGFGFNLAKVDRDWTPELEAWIRTQLNDR